MSLYDGTFALFLDILQPPPRSTLFPYTTLFRSAPMAKVDPAIRSQKAADLTACDMAAELVVDDKEFSSGSASSLKDRKSTRLNSSHRCISYAVFCLKKKKMKKMMQDTVINATEN